MAWVTTMADHQLSLSAMTIAELQQGVECARIHAPYKALEIERWIDSLSESFQVLALNTAVCRDWARLMHGKSRDLTEDALIAATARVHKLTVATRNTADFRLLDVPLLNPFKVRQEA